MKTVLVIPDGVADEPQPQLNNRTPLQAANVPHMDAVAECGQVGRTDNVPASMPSGSDVGTMSLFGYDTLKFHTGRAPIEAAAQGIELADGDWAVRCNLVTVLDDVMVSFTAEQFPNDAGRELISLLQKDQCGDSHWKYHAGVSYRNLLLYRARGTAAPFTAETSSTPPHDITDQPIADYLPQGPGADQLLALMNRSRELFADAAPNVARRAADQLPATQTWLWGLGRRPALEPFVDRYGKRGAVITAVDLLRGMGRLIGWDVVEVDGATGYLDTDYAAKGRAAIETLKRDDVDFLVVHVEATDEASHEGDTAAKLAAVENIDRHIVGPVHDWLKSQGDYRLLVCPDHPTFLRTRTHSHGYCPFAMCGTGIEVNSPSTYDEVAASNSDLVFDEGHRLMGYFLNY
ncbi:cofactor-independent phosphoglycerate mutase [Fuerstiella marisgermanici]|uniref:Cofactor-independent phosphoglycerate mutase n=1 Tax=Fuerstiella marisgermanici TaxID=1891926 RepID=A0A1P8WM31_9PLAN|nr:cofactor-independent phosphoglycerate mutase [Fuerstiella marisgermanici]APZ95109.1 cofactor-independent phosphoglycerate mutase [Fuerstiella marisgermanici]